MFIRELKHFNSFYCILKTMMARVIQNISLLSFSLLLLCLPLNPFNSGSQIINEKIVLLCLVQSVFSISFSKIRSLSSLKEGCFWKLFDWLKKNQFHFLSVNWVEQSYFPFTKKLKLTQNNSKHPILPNDCNNQSIIHETI